MTPAAPGDHDAIRIAVIDDHPIVRLAVARLVASEPGLEVVASGATVPEAIAQSTLIDVALLDLRLAAGPSVKQNVRLLQSLDAHVLAYTSAESPSLLREAARAGAIGLVKKSEEPHVLVAAIREVAAGRLEVSAEWAAAIDGDSRLQDAGLTAREREVLARYAAGQDAASVGRALHISKETVLSHIKRIRKRYADVDRVASTKVQLYQRAVEDRLFDEQ